MRIKPLLSGMLALVLLLTLLGAKTGALALGQSRPVQLYVEGKPMTGSSAPVVENGIARVPVRAFVEALGASLRYEQTSVARLLYITHGSNEVKLSLGKEIGEHNGKSIKLGAPVTVKKGVAWAPLRSLAASLGASVLWEAQQQTIYVNTDPLSVNPLPVVGTADKLGQLLSSTLSGNMYMSGFANEAAEAAPTAGSDAATGANAAGRAGDYSDTNVQVEGVDEGDWAKTDGRHIFQLTDNRVAITDISNPQQPVLRTMLEFEESFMPQELYIHQEQLIVIGHSYLPAEASTYGSATTDTASPAVETIAIGSDARIGIMPYMPMHNMVKALIYELPSTGSPVLVREVEQEGYLLSSRLIGSALYLISNKSLWHLYPLYYRGNIQEEAEPDIQELAAAFQPLYRDSEQQAEPVALPLDQIHYFPDAPEQNLLLIGGLDLNAQEKPFAVSSYMGSGQLIYASQSHLYVGISKWEPQGNTHTQSTQLYKFALDGGSVLYRSEGEVPGTVLNQFSMDEHEGFLRVATTTNDSFANSAGMRSANHLYVLDDQLSIVGQVEGLAPDERIYSARFIGDRAYMVTFRTVDPLFVIDVANPRAPTVLGELKIPGYSTYLHPYDANHLIGFGQDAEEIASPWENGGTLALEKGMKIALFDVTDVTQPKEKFSTMIGDRGSYSDLLYDHKALLFSREQGLLAFPAFVTEMPDASSNSTKPADPFAHGTPIFQGALVYRLDLETGFTLQGQISHLTAAETAGLRNYNYDYRKTVRRIMYNSGSLLTLSDQMLKVNDVTTLQEVGSLSYPIVERSYEKYEDLPASSGQGPEER